MAAVTGTGGILAVPAPGPGWLLPVAVATEALAVAKRRVHDAGVGAPVARPGRP